MSSPTHSPSRDEPRDEFVQSAPIECDPADLPITDWMIRPFEGTGRAPWLVGLGIAVVVFGISISFRFFLDEYGYRPNDALQNPFFWVDTLFAVLIAYVATAHATERRRMLRDLSQLWPTLSGSSTDQIDRAREILCIEPRELLIAGILGGSLLGVLPAIDDSYWTDIDPGIGDPSMLFLIVRNFVIGWIAGHALITEIQATRAFSRLGKMG